MDLAWKQFIEYESKKNYYGLLKDILDKEYNNFVIFPKKGDIFKAFELTPLQSVKCVIVGQDPYFNKGEAQGLSFSVPAGIKLPPTLKNIYKELNDDLGILRTSGDLTDLANKGVLLLNRVLTVREKEPNSHVKIGWLNFTLACIELLSNLESPIVFMLWGTEAKKLKTIINKRHLILESSHPSPLSSYRGFLGSKPFSKCNDFLIKNSKKPIDWGNNG